MRLITEAGYLKPTPLQKKVIPLILKGRHLAVEAGEQTGKTASYLLPLLHKIKRGKPGVKILILTATIENARKANKFFTLFSNKKLTRLNAVLLDEETEARKEYRLLQKQPDIIIGTSKRVIDHIRRDNLTFQTLQAMVIDAPPTGEPEPFNLDAEFILSKIPRKIQTLYFSPVPLTTASLGAIIRRPVIINKIDWSRNTLPPQHQYFRLKTENQKFTLLYSLILTRKGIPLFVFCASPEKAQAVKNYLATRQIRASVFDPVASEVVAQHFFDEFQNKTIKIALFPHSLDPGKINFSEVALVINFDLSPNLQKQLKYILLNTQDNIEIISFVDNDFNLDALNLQEINKLNTKEGITPSEDDILKGLINKIVGQIKEEENPEELNDLKKLIKKNVPLLFRGYFMAYLFKQSMSSQLGLGHSRAAGSNEATTRLFINIGKKSKIFPRDLISLFCTKLDIDKAMLKEIKILDNYSFVEIDSSLAQKAISVISNSDYKGRKIAVNFARKKDKSRPAPARRPKRADS